MGQYLAIGLTYRLRVSKKAILKAGVDTTKLVDLMKNQIAFMPELYDVKETKDLCEFTLKDEVLQAPLIPFLEDFYADYYEGRYSSAARAVIEQLRGQDLAARLKSAEERDHQMWQMSTFGCAESVDTPRFDSLTIECTDLMLALQGKAFLET